VFSAFTGGVNSRPEARPHSDKRSMSSLDLASSTTEPPCSKLKAESYIDGRNALPREASMSSAGDSRSSYTRRHFVRALGVTAAGASSLLLPKMLRLAIAPRTIGGRP
jgi:hypothetical protein